MWWMNDLELSARLVLLPHSEGHQGGPGVEGQAGCRQERSAPVPVVEVLAALGDHLLPGPGVSLLQLLEAGILEPGLRGHITIAVLVLSPLTWASVTRWKGVGAAWMKERSCCGVADMVAAVVARLRRLRSSERPGCWLETVFIRRWRRGALCLSVLLSDSVLLSVIPIISPQLGQAEGF